jgi:benzil reductase ((S)-benzoin forming)
MTNKILYIVTGSSSGIGKAMVGDLVKNPTNFVIGIARNNELNTENYRFEALDLSKIDRVHDFQFPDFSDYSAIHLINNAGSLGEINTHDKIKLGQIEATMTVNYTAPMILATKFIQASQSLSIIKTIINISSGAATGAYASWANYCASKAAIEMFSKCINVEQESMKYPIISYSIAPGVVDTAMQAYIRQTDIENFAMKPKFEELYTEKKLYTPLSVAHELIKVTENPENYPERVFRVQI